MVFLSWLGRNREVRPSSVALMGLTLLDFDLVALDEMLRTFVPLDLVLLRVDLLEEARTRLELFFADPPASEVQWRKLRRQR